MKQRVAVITLPVADLAAARAFYCEGLGWTPEFAEGDIMFFQFNGFVLALWAKSSFQEDIGAERLAEGYKMALAHNVESPAEVDRILAHAASVGARILRAGRALPWGGYAGSFADPDDHVWEVAHNPAWPISEEGYVRFVG